jgi:hypothetical protein
MVMQTAARPAALVSDGCILIIWDRKLGLSLSIPDILIGSA